MKGKKLGNQMVVNRNRLVQQLDAKVVINENQIYKKKKSVATIR